MPGGAQNRWEGTHTYKKPEAIKRRARTVAQLREEAAANSRANREEAISKRRGSIGGSLGLTPVHSVERPKVGRRGSTSSIPVPDLNTAQKGSDTVAGTAAEELGDMPNSGKKKRNSSGNAGAGGQEDSAGDGVDPALKRFLNMMKNDLMETTREAVGRLETRLERNEASIAALEKRVERGEKAIDEKIKVAMSKHGTEAGSGPVAAGTGPSSKREASYNYCRRSLRMWPVEGELLADAVRCFLKEKLKLTDGRIRALGSIEATPMPGKAARDKKEALVTFESVEDRDNVKANGVNLAGHKDIGMSIHVPGFLMDDLIALNGLGYAVKQKNPGVKRSVKFDDRNMGLYLDMFVSGKWKRVTPDEAKQVLKEVPSASTASSTSISVADLTDLVRGREVVVVDEEMED